jgi:hypothetical protein
VAGTIVTRTIAPSTEVKAFGPRPRPSSASGRCLAATTKATSNGLNSPRGSALTSAGLQKRLIYMEKV